MQEPRQSQSHDQDSPAGLRVLVAAKFSVDYCAPGLATSNTQSTLRKDLHSTHTKVTLLRYLSDRFSYIFLRLTIDYLYKKDSNPKEPPTLLGDGMETLLTLRKVKLVSILETIPVKLISRSRPLAEKDSEVVTFLRSLTFRQMNAGVQGGRGPRERHHGTQKAISLIKGRIPICTFRQHPKLI